MNFKNASCNKKGGTVFAYSVRDPERYGVAIFNEKNELLDIIEKPESHISRWAITGLYFYDKSVVKRSKLLKPSKRGELEITDLNNSYLRDGLLKIEKMGRGMVWLDTGNHDSLHEACSYIRTIEHRQGLKISCPEEVAFKSGWIDKEQLLKLAATYPKGEYQSYLNLLPSYE